jgi:two-component system sensor histidine kinase AlgZ
MNPIHPSSDNLFLPNFCEVRLVFGGVVLAQLLACVLFFAQLGKPASLWQTFALVSLYIQWIALSSALALCLLRRALARLGNRLALALSYLVVLGVTLIFTELAWRLVLQPDPGAASYWLRYHAFVAQNLGISAIVGAVGLRYFYLRHGWEKTALAEAEARIQALQSRIRPHFLFNGMNTIASLIRVNPAQAEQAVEDLAELFRAALADPRKRVTLQEELELCRHYLDIETMRLGSRLQVAWQLQTVPMDALLPPLLLQPLIENAVLYGIEPLPEGGTIRVSGLCDGKLIRFEVENPIAPLPPARRRGNRIALDNLRQRLNALHGSQGRLEIKTSDGMYRVCLRFPYEAEKTG